ncbi:MAG: SGNH/GDSL hydrolase family protein [Isosphaeraceae bacterium]|nr:SGNH/GDSL hydrolase family protein [Isosphaeraceae bacterium]
MSTAPSTASGRLSRVQNWRRRGLVIGLSFLIVFAVSLLAAEIAARAIVWAWRIPTQFEAKPFQQFGQTDPRLWWKLQPNLDTEMLGVKLRTNHRGFRDDREDLAPGTFRVYCLGDSSTFGWRVTRSEMFTSVAERSLRAAAGRSVGLVSAGVPGYTSYQCRQQFRELIAPLRPDVVVVLASNNECRARNLGDRERGRLLARKEALHHWLGFSRTWLLISRAPDALSRTWDLKPNPGRVANTPAEYRENLRELIHDARAINCQIVVMNMPLRLRFKPIWKHYDRPNPEVASLLRRAEEAALQGAPDPARRALLEEAVRVQPVQFAAHWMLAELELATGRSAEAERQFVLAREGDLHPDATKPSYNQTLAELCALEKVRFIDLDRLFRESTEGSETLFMDHCHPSPSGHLLIGRALARVLSEFVPAR